MIENPIIIGIINESATIGGINLLTKLPIVDPNSIFGIIIITTLKSIRDVFLLGCLFGMRSKKLNKAVPVINGYAKVVA